MDSAWCTSIFLVWLNHKSCAYRFALHTPSLPVCLNHKLCHPSCCSSCHDGTEISCTAVSLHFGSLSSSFDFQVRQCSRMMTVEHQGSRHQYQGNLLQVVPASSCPHSATLRQSECKAHFAFSVEQQELTLC